MELTCRYYSQELPNLNDSVVVKIKKFNDFYITTELLEYNNIKGIIGINEISNTRLKSPNLLKLKSKIKINDIYVCIVLNIDENNYVELSLKKHTHDKTEAKDIYSKNKKINNLFLKIANDNKLNNDKLLDLYTNTVWFLENKNKNRLECFKYFLSINDIKDLNIFNISENDKILLFDEIKKQFNIPIKKIKCEFEIYCYTYEGIDSIKLALKHGLSFSNDVYKITLKLITSPLYYISISTNKYNEGISFLMNVVEQIKLKILELNGIFSIIKPPEILSDNDEELFNNRIHDLIEKHNSLHV